MVQSTTILNYHTGRPKNWTMKGRMKNGKCNGWHRHSAYDALRRGEAGMREPNGYRETLEYLSERTGNKGWVTVTEIARILKVDRSTVNRRFGIYKGCALPVLAMRICEESK